MGLNEIFEVSKPRIIILLVITAVTSMYAGSKLVGPELSGLDILHIIIAGSLASAGSSALNHFYDKDIDLKMKRTSKRPIPSGRSKPTTVLIYGLSVSIISGMERTSKYILANTIILLPYSLMLYAFGMGILYTVIAAIAGGLMLLYHYKLTKTPTSDFAWKAYKVTAPYLTIIFIGIALDAAFHYRF